jgi:hypothetical protein
MAINLALDLVLQHAASFRQLADHNEVFSAMGNLAHIGRNPDLLSDRELVWRHVHLRCRLELRSQCFARCSWCVARSIS